MGFFKDLKEDLSQAVNELSEEAMPTGEPKKNSKSRKQSQVIADDEMVDTLNEDVNDEIAATSEEAIMSEALSMDDAALEESFNKALENVGNIVPEDFAADNEEDKEIPQDEPVDMKIEEPVVETVEEPDCDNADKISDETAIITPGLSITGDIESAGSIELLGKVIGNVSCMGKLVVSGTINGNTSSSDFFANKAKIEGDIYCSGTAKIGTGSIIIGNLSATSAVIAGAIKGDIDVHGPVIVDSGAIIMGNIKSKSVQINNGAVIEGYCSQCYSDNSPKKFFDC